MRRSCVLFCALLLAVTPSPTSAHYGDDIEYTTNGVIILWCDSDPHPLVPVGAPEAYDDPIDWLFSGEPECAANDARNTIRESAGEDRDHLYVGGGVWLAQPETWGNPATAWATDTVPSAAGAPLTFRSSASDSNSAEGCGQVHFTVPSLWYDHWLESVDPYLWVFVRPLGTTADLDVCAGSTGTLHLEI